MHARCRRFRSCSSRFCFRIATVASSRFLRLSVAVSRLLTPFLWLLIFEREKNKQNTKERKQSLKKKKHKKKTSFCVKE